MIFKKGLNILSMTRGYHGSDELDVAAAIRHVKNLGFTSDDCSIRKGDEAINVYMKKEIKIDRT